MNISAANERSKCFAGRAEQIAVFVLLFASFSLEFNAAFHGGSQGQDFYYHRRLTSEAAKNPLHFFFAPSGYADPPGYYILGSAIYNTFGEKNWIVAMGLLGALVNTAALFVLHLISRLFIRSPKNLCPLFGRFFTCFLNHVGGNSRRFSLPVAVSAYDLFHCIGTHATNWI
jgi:hypothetical protein